MRFPEPEQTFPGPEAISRMVVLNRRRFGYEQKLGPFSDASMTWSTTLVESLATAMVLRLEAEMLCLDDSRRTQTVTRPVEWFMPDGWWQHWKATTGIRWPVSRWWCRRYPARMMTVTRQVSVSVKWVERVGFPQADLPYDRLGKASMTVLLHGEPVWAQSPPRYGPEPRDAPKRN